MLTPEERSERSRKAAQTRRENKIAEENRAKEEQEANSSQSWWWTVPVLIAVLLVALLLWHPWTSVATPAALGAGSAVDPTAAPSVIPAAVGNFVLQPNTLGEKPAVGENVDPNIYKKPYEAGTITDLQGNGTWTQSGKDGSANLHGTIPADTWLEVDTYSLTKDGKNYNGGILLVVKGPLDLEKVGISYRNGGANLITGDVQMFVNDNIYGKFCRGDIIVDVKTKQPVLDTNGDLQFKYKPWALTYIMLPEGITFPKFPGSCPKSRVEDTTTYPQ
jgi:hypothetical protein